MMKVQGCCDEFFLSPPPLLLRCCLHQSWRGRRQRLPCRLIKWKLSCRQRWQLCFVYFFLYQACLGAINKKYRPKVLSLVSWPVAFLESCTQDNSAKTKSLSIRGQLSVWVSERCRDRRTSWGCKKSTRQGFVSALDRNTNQTIWSMINDLVACWWWAPVHRSATLWR